jgi:poly(hydroxyalkanoate) depolymerase family esterase
MSSFEKAMAHLHDLRSRFEGLLDAARQKALPEEEAPVQSRTELQELTDFGRNPGNLRMFAYVPEDLPGGAPLVVALHGCSQTAAEYDRGSGWSVLADRLGFAVVYPEQQAANNPKNCFSWFLPGDTTRDLGEARSIRQMIEYAIATFGVDKRRVFVTGLSAGGAMASTMLAAYPEVFAGGAIIAGLPFGAARSVQQAFDAMFTEQTHAPDVLGDRVRSASRHRGPWPKLSIWHGSADPIVKPSNFEEIIRQWTDVHELSAAPSFEETIGGHTTRRVWSDANGDAQIEAFLVNGMAHGVPLASTLGKNNCGATGPFFFDAGISSTHHIAKFWRLGEALAETSRGVAVSAPRSIKAENRDRAVAKAASDNASAESNPAHAANAAPDVRGLFDPNIAIAAAFKAAGLPVPDLPNASAATLANVNPNPVIQAALKAAGLRRLNRH